MALIQNATIQGTIATYLSTVDPSGGKMFWIGLNDLGQEGNYVWQDGTAATYFNWRSGEPNDADGSSDCVLVAYASQGRSWDDAGCYSTNINAFCQKITTTP